MLGQLASCCRCWQSSSPQKNVTASRSSCNVAKELCMLAPAGAAAFIANRSSTRTLRNVRYNQ